MLRINTLKVANRLAWFLQYCERTTDIIWRGKKAIVDSIGKVLKMMILNKKRRAIILYDGSAGELVGARRDVKNYRNFLSSPYGGSWKEDEVYECNVRQVSTSDMKQMFVQLLAEYILLIYVGHGGQDGEGRTFFRVKDGEKCYISDINHLAKKQVTIADCCRVYVPGPVLESTMLKEASQKIGDTSAAFIAQLEKAEEQTITIYACAPGEEAMDTPSYSSCLIDYACCFLQEKQEKIPLCLTIKEAHELADEYLMWFSQHPQIEFKPRTADGGLPFGITLSGNGLRGSLLAAYGGGSLS